MKNNGYWGKILRVDLENEEITEDEFTEEMAKKWIGGVGLATKIIYDEVPEDADPLGPENVFVFAVGPFQGSGILGNGRFAACAHSPLTGIWGESLGGGYNAEELKKAGYDAIVVTGKADKPVYLWVHDGEAELRDASDLWGKDSYETEDAIKDELDDDNIRVAPIGQAAENLVRYAGLICNHGHGCAGRMGMGAVMGSKNLKAIALRGTMDTPEPANPEELESVKNEILPIIQESDFTERNRKYGQPMAVIPREELGLLPIKNFSVDRWQEGAQKLGADEGEYDEVLKPDPDACSTCLMGCHRRVTVDDPEDYSMDSYGPEYETLGMMGSNCMIDNLLAVNKANELCNRYGLDTIDFGGVCAFAMEAYEKGKIDKDDLGFELNWGDGDAMIKLLHKIANREGEIPKLLGEGLRPAGEELGCPELAVQANGAAVPAHDPRAFFSMAVETVTSTRGACHLHGFPEAYELGGTYESLKSVLPEPLDRFATEKKGLAQAKCQDRAAVFNCLPWCRLYAASGVDLTHIAELLSAITGWDITSDDLLRAGERVVNLQRMFNLKQGLDPEKDDKLPERLMKPPEADSEIRKIPPLDEMLEEYYEVKNWPDGIPSEGKLDDLGLGFAKKDLPK